MTAVICWSMKIKMVASSAGTAAKSADHHGLLPNGSMNHVLSLRVGWW